MVGAAREQSGGAVERRAELEDARGRVGKVCAEGGRRKRKDTKSEIECLQAEAEETEAEKAEEGEEDEERNEEEPVMTTNLSNFETRVTESGGASSEENENERTALAVA